LLLLEIPSAGRLAALVVALDAVSRKSFELVARSEAESVAQPLDVADATFDGAVQRVALTARYDGVLRLYQEPLAPHLTCTGVPSSLSLSEMGA